MGQIRTIDGRYRLEEVISAGSFSTVYRAFDLQSGQHVGLKIIAPRLRENRPDVFLRLQHEAALLAQLNHPALVPLRHVGQSDGQFYLVQEYTNAPSLAELLRQPTSVIAHQLSILEIIKQVADALAHVHRQGIIHRDLKPSNLIIVQDGESLRVRLLDFGLAQLQRITYEQLEETGSSETAAYLAPEQSGLLSRAVDARSDLYSLGVIFYELLAGQLPFQADSVSGFLHQHLARRPPSLRRFRPDVSPVLEQIVLKLLAKNPDERYQTASGLLADLQRFSRGENLALLGTGDLRPGLREQTAFTGRVHEQTLLRETWRKAAGGRGQVVVIDGPTGIGKTRLLETLIESVADRGGLFLQARCPRPEAQSVAPPYKPFGEALKALLARLPALPEKQRQLYRELLQQKVKALGPQILSIVPALKTMFEGETSLETLPGLESERQDTRFKGLLASLWLSLATPEYPLVLALEDWQWADSNSIELLNILLTRLENVPLLLVISAVQSNEIRASLEQLLNLDSKNSVPKIKAPIRYFSLSGLSLPDTIQFINSLSGPEDRAQSQVADALIKRLYGLSQGNPLFIQEALKILHRQGTLKYSERGWYYTGDQPAELVLPLNAAELLLQRLAQLSLDLQRFFGCAAVLGQNFSFEQLNTLWLELTKADNSHGGKLVEWLQQGLADNLIFEMPDQPGCYNFSHQKIREGFYQFLSEEERQHLHYAAGRLLAARAESSVYDLAVHFLKSSDPAQATHYAIRAGDQAFETYAYQDAIRFYEIALAHLNHLVEVGPVREKLAEAYLALRKYEQAEQLYRELIKETGQPSRKARYAQKLGDTLFQKGDVAAAIAHLEEALRLLGEKRPRTKPGLIWSIGRQALHQGFHSLGLIRRVPTEQIRPEQLDALLIYSGSNYPLLYEMLRGAEIHLRALNLVERFDVPQARTRVYTEHGLLTAALGWQRRSQKYLSRAEKLAEQHHNLLALVYVNLFRGMAALFQGQYQVALKWLEKALPIAQSLDLPGVLRLIHNQRATCYFYLADLPNALSTLNILDELAGGLDDTFDRAADYVQPGILLLSGNIEQAEQRANFLLEKAREAHLTVLEILMETALAQIKIDAGRWKEARWHADMAFELVRRHSFRVEQIKLVFPVLAEAYLGNGSSCSPKVRRLAKEALRRTQNFPNHRAYAWRMAGQVAWAAGQTAQAEKCWQKSLGLAQSLGQRYEEARTFYEMGRLLLTREETLQQARGRDYLRRAYLHFSDIGASRYIEKIMRLAPEITGGYQTNREQSALLQQAQEEEARLRAELVRQRRLAGLVEVGRELSAILDIDRLLERIVAVAMEVLGAERGFVLLYNEANELSVRVARSLNQDLSLSDSSLNFLILHEAEQSDQPLLVADARNDPRFNSYISAAADVRSVICVPLVARSKEGVLSRLGFLYADNRLLDNLFSENDEHLLALFAAFAGQAAIAIENARLFSAEQEALRQKEAALVELQFKNEKLRQATDLLLNADADLRTIVSEQLHNVLKHRTSQLQSQLRQLMRQLEDTDPQMVAQVGAALKRMSGTANELSDGLRSTQMLVEDAFHRRTLGVVMHLRKVVEDLEMLHAESPLRVSCQLEALEEVLGPFPERLEESEEGGRLCDVIASAVTQALLNAYDHSQASEVVVSSAVSDDWLFVRVRDNGRGFEVAAMPAHTRSLRKLIRKAELLEGAVNISSAPGQGTCLELRMPLAKIAAVTAELALAEEIF
jgi:GAF domain-containing protein/tetratricopeptide (TPR) repeat protein